MSIILVLIISISTFLLATIFKLAKLLRLTIPLLYIAIVLVLFKDWYDANTLLAHAILGVLTLLVIISWIISIYKTIESKRVKRRQNELDLIINSERLYYVKVKRDEK